VNKTQLIEQLKQPEAQINSLLSAAAISADLEIYTDDQLEILQALDEIVASGKAKTHKDAAKLYRQQQETSTTSENSAQAANNLDEFIQSLANQAADSTFANLPNIAIEEHHRLKALFVQRYRQRIMERLQDPEFQQQFQAAIEGQDLGKLKLLSGTTSNMVLPNNSSFSN